MVKPLQDIVKQNIEYKWEEKQKEAFKSIKEAMAREPSLMSPDFSKEFLLYTFTSNTSYVTFLTEKNWEGNEVLLHERQTRRSIVEISISL